MTWYDPRTWLRRNEAKALPAPSQGDLQREVARPNRVGFGRSVWHTSVASGLTTSRLAEVLDDADQGYGYDYLTLAAEMERRDAHYYSVLQTRKLAVLGLSHDVEPVSDDARDVEVADFIREVTESGDFRHMLFSCLDAIAKGYSCTEVLWDSVDGRWLPCAYAHRDPRWFVLDRETGQQIRLRTGTEWNSGVELPPYKFVIHAPRLGSMIPLQAGVARIVAAYHVFKAFTLADWLRLSELHGEPFRLAEASDELSDDERASLMRAAIAMGKAKAVMVPKGSSISLVSSNIGGGTGANGGVHPVLIKWINKEISKAVLGSNVIDEEGGSFAKAESLEKFGDDRTISDARQLEDTINGTLIRWLVALNFGPDVPCPRWSMDTSQQEDLGSLADAMKEFLDRGLQVPQWWVAEKFGVPVEQIPEEALLHPKGQASPPDDGEGDDMGEEPDDTDDGPSEPEEDEGDDEQR